MTINAYLTLAILVVTFGLLIKTKLPAVCIFMTALATAITFKLAPTQELLKGFSNQDMLTVAVLYMVAAGMYSTGAITAIMDKIQRNGKGQASNDSAIPDWAAVSNRDTLCMLD